MTEAGTKEEEENRADSKRVTLEALDQTVWCWLETDSSKYPVVCWLDMHSSGLKHVVQKPRIGINDEL